MSESRRIEVNLGPRSYPVLIGAGQLGGLGATLRAEGLKQAGAFVITDPNVGGRYFENVRVSLEAAGFAKIVRHDITAGEAGKNWDEFTKACGALLEAFPDAATAPLVLLLGGGVVGDLGGFAAAVFRRGVPFVQIPTSLLAAVDSSVGGKVAVNFGGVKNIMGAFSQPRLVVCDLDTLGTLGPREVRSGMAEVIKYGAVCSRALFGQLEAGALEKMLALEPVTLTDIVAQCVRLKADVVEQDELDRLGIRNVLNFGHTIGHALELSADYALTHGEAIAIGMVAATRMSVRLGMANGDFQRRLTALLERAGLPLVHKNAPGLFDRIVRALQLDKKFRDGKNLFVLPTGIGSWAPRENVDWSLVHDCVRTALV
ncbi:MAG: 3-dehydroquinate synthase [Chthoniobacteraceae bacterium]